MLDYWERKRLLLQKQAKGLVKKTQKPCVQIRLASLIEESIVDGPGLRFVLFTQGCPHRCPGCHNPQTHLSVGGSFFSLEKILSLYQQHPACRGITFSGGEPFTQAASLAKVAKAIHQARGDVVVYTGYRIEQLNGLAKVDEGIMALLNETDLLIDGPYIQQKRCLGVPFVGSLNQRLLALSSAGNHLLADIPVLPEGRMIKRVYYSV